MEDNSRRENYRHIIENAIQDLPALPTVVAKVLELADNPSASAMDMERIISSEPAIASKVLRVVNSAYYGMGRKIYSISQAIVVLGFGQVKNLVVSMAVMNLISGHTHSITKLHYAFWRHSVATSVATVQLANNRGVRKEVKELASVGGLLHDIGSLYLLVHLRDVYRKVLLTSSQKAMPLRLVEEEIIGIDHAEIGGMLTTAWNFPQDLVQVIANHHHPERDRENEALVLVHAGDFYANLSGFPIIPLPEFDVDDHVLDSIGISHEQDGDIVEEIQFKVRAAEDWFDIFAATG